MEEGRRAVGLMLCAQVLVLGVTVGDRLTVYRQEIKATTGHSILLPVAFTLTHQFSRYTVEWEVGNESILYHTVMNCTLDAQGTPTWILDETFVVYPVFSGKVEFYKMNSSLLIYNVSENDSGIYKVSFSTKDHTSIQRIIVRVQASDSDAASSWKTWIFALRTVLCFLPLAALLLILHVWG